MRLAVIVYGVLSVLALPLVLGLCLVAKRGDEQLQAWHDAELERELGIKFAAEQEGP